MKRKRSVFGGQYICRGRRGDVKDGGAEDGEELAGAEVLVETELAAELQRSFWRGKGNGVASSLLLSHEVGHGKAGDVSDRDALFLSSSSPSSSVSRSLASDLNSFQSFVVCLFVISSSSFLFFRLGSSRVGKSSAKREQQRGEMLTSRVVSRLGAGGAQLLRSVARGGQKSLFVSRSSLSLFPSVPQRSFSLSSSLLHDRKPAVK